MLHTLWLVTYYIRLHACTCTHTHAPQFATKIWTELPPTQSMVPTVYLLWTVVSSCHKGMWDSRYMDPVTLKCRIWCRGVIRFITGHFAQGKEPQSSTGESGKSVGHKRMQHNLYVRKRFEFATDGGIEIPRWFHTPSWLYMYDTCILIGYKWQLYCKSSVLWFICYREKDISPRLFIEICFLCIVRIVYSVQPFTAWLRTSQKDIQNWKTMTNCITGWKSHLRQLRAKW